MVRLVFTCGDINGIGPEICLKTFNRIFNPRKRQIFFLCPKNVFNKISQVIPPGFRYQIITKSSFEIIDKSKVTIIDSGDALQTVGRPTKVSGKLSYNAIIDSVNLVQSNFADAIITAPISKQAFKLAEIKFPGHTELLAKLSHSKNFMMLFISKKMKCGLATIHLPLNKVSQSITKEKINDSLITLCKTLKNDFAITEPKIAVLGLNPHAGENGNIGNEENKIIIPVINSIKNVNAFGPFVPDSFFGNHLYKKFDAVLGMYHDQVLIPFKMLNFNLGVNYTAGLPFLRTSPDHGTAFDIAGKGIASEESMVQSVYLVEKILMNRRKINGF
ncbi:MAG: 4-hydroxythreonine-4-phosphate dehydrogenase PdxA [Bacteroidota bacterium]